MHFTLSKTARIITLLVIDTCFFFVELIVGYAVGSLALVADSFHMLNDVLSLIVALYAIKLSKTSPSSRYSYGWHRAEILAALINGVFLLALCFSIFMEALEKFINTPIVSNPMLVVIVGSLGLASNIVGLFLFHDHAHSSHTAEIHDAAHEGTLTESTPLLPENGHLGRQRKGSDSSVYGHPIQNRAYVLQTAHDMQNQPDDDSTSATPSYNGDETPEPRPTDAATGDALLALEEGSVGTDNLNANSHGSPRATKHTRSKSARKHSSSPSTKHHSHHHGHSGSMNMRALVLHVLGDALGNVGVIATGLIIWLSDWSFKYYFDPIISLVITMIIFSSSLPLVRSASAILLQGVPSFISLDRVREEICAVPGVLSVHELHVWQLSESKIVASVHVWVSSTVDYMSIASRIRQVLHDHGVHSSTVQPEFYNADDAIPEDRLMTSADTRCLLRCPPGQACDVENTCCPPGQAPKEFSSRPPSPPSPGN